MKKISLLMILLAGTIANIPVAKADYFFFISTTTQTYDFSSTSIPNTVGATTAWLGTTVYPTSFQIGQDKLNSVGSYIKLNVGTTLLGDGVTWTTSNPAIGIQYKLSTSPVISGLDSASSVAPSYKLTMTGYPTGGQAITVNGKLNLAYRLVRLKEQIPAGKITGPSVSATFYNTYDGATKTDVLYSGAATQPTYTPCTIDAPTEIKLPTLYFDDLVNGAQGASQTYSIKLKNCPGAMTSISYMLAPIYGGFGGSNNGTFYTATGDGYAKYVYLQLQNADGTGRTINEEITLDNYTGNGDYTIPDFKVAYYIKDVTKATEGNVQSALVIDVTYN